MLENIRESAVVWNNTIFKHLLCAVSHRTLYVHYFIEVSEQLHELGNCYYLHFRDEEKDTESKQLTQGHIANLPKSDSNLSRPPEPCSIASHLMSISVITNKSCHFLFHLNASLTLSLTCSLFPFSSLCPLFKSIFPKQWRNKIISLTSLVNNSGVLIKNIIFLREEKVSKA